jgi:L-iditol 2-dehydrogenase
MRAAVLYGKEDVRLEQITPAPLEVGEVRIQIEAALTCGTDLKVFKRGYHAKMIVPPAVFGHELAGFISESRTSPAGASHWKVGERVAVANSAPCGICFYCSKGQENLCDDLLFLNGAYAESIVVPARIVEKNLLRLRDTTKFRDAALVEPLACVVQGIQETQLQADHHLLVLGAGPIGLMFAALARYLGFYITIAGRRQPRLDTARRLGAQQVINIGNEQNVVEIIRGSSGTRFDAVIEAVGKPETWEAAVQLVRKGGAVNFFGGCPAGTNITLDTGLLHYSNLTLRASFHHTPRTIRKALDFIENGVIHSGDFVDGKSSLSELPNLFKRMAAGNQTVKTLIDTRA